MSAWLRAAVVSGVLFSYQSAASQTLTPGRVLFKYDTSLVADSIRDLLQDSAVVAVAAEGDFRNLLGNPQPSTKPATGFAYFSLGKQLSILSIKMGLLGKTDTLKARFGEAMRFPLVGGSLDAGNVSVLIDYRRFVPHLHGLGLHVYAGWSQAIWRDSVQGHPAPDAANAVFKSVGALLTWEAVNVPINEKTFAIHFDLGFTGRALGGDIANPANDSLRLPTLRTMSTSFGGLEAGVQVGFKDALLGVSYYDFGGGVPGFSGARLAFGAAIYSTLLAHRFRMNVRHSPQRDLGTRLRPSAQGGCRPSTPQV